MAGRRHMNFGAAPVLFHSSRQPFHKVDMNLGLQPSPGTHHDVTAQARSSPRDLWDRSRDQRTQGWGVREERERFQHDDRREYRDRALQDRPVNLLNYELSNGRPFGRQPSKALYDIQLDTRQKGPFVGRQNTPYVEKEDRPFNERHDRPFNERHDRPFNERQNKPFNDRYDRHFDERRDRPFDESHDRQFNQRHDRQFNEIHDRPLKERQDVQLGGIRDRPINNQGLNSRHVGGEPRADASGHEHPLPRIHTDEGPNTRIPGNNVPINGFPGNKEHTNGIPGNKEHTNGIPGNNEPTNGIPRSQALPNGQRINSRSEEFFRPVRESWNWLCVCCTAVVVVTVLLAIALGGYYIHQYITEKNRPAYEVVLNGTATVRDVTYISAYENLESALSKTFIQDFCNKMNTTLTELVESVDSCTVTGLRNGSVVISFNLHIKSKEDMDSIQETLSSALVSDNRRNNFSDAWTFNTNVYKETASFTTDRVTTQWNTPTATSTTTSTTSQTTTTATTTTTSTTTSTTSATTISTTTSTTSATTTPTTTATTPSTTAPPTSDTEYASKQDLPTTETSSDDITTFTTSATDGETESVNTDLETESVNTDLETESVNTDGETESVNTDGETESVTTDGETEFVTDSGLGGQTDDITTEVLITSSGLS